MLARNWKQQWLPLCFARRARRTSMERPVARLMISNQNLRVSWKPVNPHDCVWKSLYRVTMRRMHCNITMWYTTLLLCLKPWRYGQQKQQWIKNERNLKRFGRGTWQKVRSKSEVIDEATTKGSKVHVAALMSFEECRIGDKTPKIQWSSCTSKRHCERWFRVLCSIHWTRIFSISNDGSKSHGYHLQTAGLRRTSSGRSICWNPGPNGRCSQFNEKSRTTMSRHLDSSTTTQMAYGRVSRLLLTEICMVILVQDCYERQFENIQLKYGWEKVSNCECFFRTPWKRVILVCMWMT